MTSLTAIGFTQSEPECVANHDAQRDFLGVYFCTTCGIKLRNDVGKCSPESHEDEARIFGCRFCSACGAKL